MAVTLTIKQVPDKLAGRLRARAASNHRSLQGELMAIIHSAVEEPRDAVNESDSPGYAAKPARNAQRKKKIPPTNEAGLTLAELWEAGRKRGLASPSESTRMIRKMRDERYGS